MGRTILKLDTSAFDDYIERLDRLGADLKPIVTDALTQAAETIQEDTVEAVKDEHLPKHGEFHHKNRPTEKSIVKPRVTWNGMVGEANAGFDFGTPGAGGYLITGTPRMKPDKELNRIYKGKRYMRDIRKQMSEVFEEGIKEHMGG